LYPFFDIYWVHIYTFGITLTACFFLFLWSLRRLWGRFGYNFSFFLNNITWYFLSVFIFSRLFFVISKWSDMKFIRDPFEFFIMSDYNFSLFGAIFGFFAILGITTKLEKTKITKYIDGVILSFFLVLFIGYVWALLWWQVYGRETTFWIEILYSHPFSLVPYQVPIFPLPIVYAITTFLLFSGLYILSIFVHIRWFIGYLWLLIFSSLILILEFFSWKFDILTSTTWLNFINLNQFFALFLAGISIYQLYKIYFLENDSKDIIGVK